MFEWGKEDAIGPARQQAGPDWSCAGAAAACADHRRRERGRRRRRAAPHHCASRRRPSKSGMLVGASPGLKRHKHFTAPGDQISIGGAQLPVDPLATVMPAKHATPNQPARDRPSGNGHFPKVPYACPFGPGRQAPIAMQSGRACRHGKPLRHARPSGRRVSVFLATLRDVARLGGPEQTQCRGASVARPQRSAGKLTDQG